MTLTAEQIVTLKDLTKQAVLAYKELDARPPVEEYFATLMRDYPDYSKWIALQGEIFWMNIAGYDPVTNEEYDKILETTTSGLQNLYVRGERLTEVHKRKVLINVPIALPWTPPKS